MSKFKIILHKSEFYEVFVDADTLEEAGEYGQVEAWEAVNWNKPIHWEYRIYDIVEEKE